jgi:hypothetical protein
MRERLRERLEGAAPWVSAAVAPVPDAGPDTVEVDGLVRPGDNGPWLDALAAGRALFLHGVLAAVDNVPLPVAPGPSPVAQQYSDAD